MPDSVSKDLTRGTETDGALPTTLDNNIVYEWILPSTFTTSARAEMTHYLAPHVSDLVRSRDQILDLCCGSGPMSFWFEEQGGEVTGVDIAPYMITLALLRRYPDLTAVVVDLETVCAAGREIAAENGLSGRLSYHAADLLYDALPSGTPKRHPL